MKYATALVLALAMGTFSCAHQPQPAWPLEMEILVDGRPLETLWHQGKNYIEAPRGAEYSVRLRNRSGERVAVALSVDGLNTIDARRTSARDASKWVLGPYEAVEISGWQVNGSTARKFYFTDESGSYGAALGKTENLGLVSASVFRERQVFVSTDRVVPSAPGGQAGGSEPSRAKREGASSGEKRAEAAPSCPPQEKDDYAATGMGRSVDHRVTRVHMDLLPYPSQEFSVRYEFRPELIRLGVIQSRPDRLREREHASGFGRGGYCPEVP